MTKQRDLRKSLGGSPAGMGFSRCCFLALAAILVTGGAAVSHGQSQPDAAKATKPVSEKKPAAVPKEVVSHGYLAHQSLEVGGRITSTGGSTSMWDTLVNQGSGGRILSQSLELRSVNPSRTPFFDTLTTDSTGYGGDAINVTRLNLSKGRLYDFAGSFRRDRNYFDYNLLDSSLLGATALVAEPDSLHLFNTVRRNTDTALTLLPLSRLSFRAGYNHGTNEGPTYSSLHGGGDVQLFQWFRNAGDTYTGGADIKLFPRTTLSYDQFFVFYKGDSSFQLAGANYQVQNAGGPMVSLGVDTLNNATCGSGANKTLSIVGGYVNPYCSATIAESESAPTRTSFPTEQLRFTSHYWGKVSFNGRLLYSGATGTVNSFNESFNGLARGNLRAEIETGAGANGQFANYKRVNTSGDFGLVAEVNSFVTLSDTFDYWNFRNEGTSTYAETKYIGTAATSILTPLASLTPAAVIATAGGSLDQKIEANTLLATVTVMPEFKLSGGWRYKNREVADSGPDDLTWHENWLLLGAVMQPSRAVRINLNFDDMNSTSATAATTGNTFTREAPNRSYHIRARATVKPDKWINFAVTANNYAGKNDDPLVNHLEHNHDFSFAATVNPTEQLSLDFNYAYDDVFSRTDICYLATPAPTGAANSGTCATAISGSATYLLGTGLYNAPSNFFAGSVNYAPTKALRLNGGARVNNVNGTAEELNPLMVPGALQSHYVTPYADVLYNIAAQWAWHGNWTHDGYSEQGPQGLLPARNTHGDIVTLGVKYAF